MSLLFKDMESVLVYLDDLIVIGSGYVEEHLATIDEVINGLNYSTMQFNNSKCEWLKV